jgi:hypothetical protein
MDINKLILTPSRAHQNQQEDTSGESTCDISRTSSSGGIDEIHDFDPDAVDFEPLLVTGCEYLARDVIHYFTLFDVFIAATDQIIFAYDSWQNTELSFRIIL